MSDTYDQIKESLQNVYEAEMEAGDVEQLMDDIRSSFKKYFPHGYINIGKGAGISKGTIHLAIGLIDDVNKLSSGIRENDPMIHKFIIFPEANGFSAELSYGNLSVNPPEGSYLAMGRVKTNWRKTRGDAKKIAKAYDTFFGRLKKIVKDNEADVYHRDMYDDKYFR